MQYGNLGRLNIKHYDGWNSFRNSFCQYNYGNAQYWASKTSKKKHYDEGELGASFWVEEEDGELFSRGDEWD